MCEENLQPVDLLHYKIPYQVNISADEKQRVRYPVPVVPESPGFPLPPTLPGLTFINAGTPDSGLSRKDMSLILNTMLPPAVWTENDGKIWCKEISDVPATRSDVTSLHQNLTMALKQRQAREKGICPIRRQLFAEVFDEIIRQVTINNAERGLLLMRIRDEIRMTLAAHIRLFESGFVYGTRKSNLVEDGYENLQTAIRELKEEKESLEVQMQNLAITIDQSERKHSETREVNEKRAADEIQFLKRANHQLREQLEGIQGIKKS